MLSYYYNPKQSYKQSFTESSIKQNVFIPERKNNLIKDNAFVII